MTPNFKEEDIKLKFIKAYNTVMEDKERILQDTIEVIELLTDTSKLEKDISKVNGELIVISELVNNLVKENAKTSTDLDDYNRKYEELSSRYEKLQFKHEEMIRFRSEKQGQALKMKSFISNLSQSEDTLSEWNERVWMLLVESAIVHRNSNITFRFQNGEETTV